MLAKSGLLRDSAGGTAQQMRAQWGESSARETTEVSPGGKGLLTQQFRPQNAPASMGSCSAPRRICRPVACRATSGSSVPWCRAGHPQDPGDFKRVLLGCLMGALELLGF